MVSKHSGCFGSGWTRLPRSSSLAAIISFGGPLSEMTRTHVGIHHEIRGSRMVLICLRDAYTLVFVVKIDEELMAGRNYGARHCA
jgi:hypothetical protein